jgi:hypothetical protein
VAGDQPRKVNSRLLRPAPEKRFGSMYFTQHLLDIKIEGKWQDALKKSLTKKKPAEGWPKA